MTAATLPSPRPAATASAVPPGLPPASEILARASSENFPVASWVLGRSARRHLMALYGFARLVDELGDDYRGDRLGALAWARAELRAAGDGTTPAHPLVAAAARSLREVGGDPALLEDLIDANVADQQVHRYSTFEDLLGYCRLSANPVGRLVLSCFGLSTPQREAWSDAVCTALQLTEHWGDVAEDAAAGRVYLPTEDLDHFGVGQAELAGYGPASASLRALMAFEVARTRALLEQGAPLVRSISGRPRLAVAGFVAGGHAALDGLAGRSFDPLSPAHRPAALTFAARLARVLLTPSRRP